LVKTSTVWAVAHKAADALEGVVIISLVLWIVGLYIRFTEMADQFRVSFFVTFLIWVFFFIFCLIFPKEGASRYDVKDDDNSIF